jgi:hypothetical protein
LKARILYSLSILNTMHIHESLMLLPNLPILLNQGFIKALNSKGVSVVVFGDLNSVPKWEIVRNCGVNGICSDTPTAIHDWLKTHPLPQVDLLKY